MAEEAKVAPAEELKSTEPAPQAEAQKPKEETVGEALKTVQQVPKKEEPEMVPLAALMDLKKDNKELTKQLKELKTAIEAGATKKEVSADLKSLADEHGVDEGFLQKFADTVRQQVRQEVEGEITTKLKPIEDKERSEKIEQIFNKHFTDSMEAMPEYKGVVNKDVIKALSLSPENANKTFTQIIEGAYGHLIQGKRTMESASTRAGKNDVLDVDVERMNRDGEYAKEVFANPLLKKKYNDSLTKRLSTQI